MIPQVGREGEPLENGVVHRETTSGLTLGPQLEVCGADDLAPEPDHGLITAPPSRRRLRSLNCIKVVTNNGTRHTCLWRAPNDRHFHAPNPSVYSMVPADTLPSVLKRSTAVMNLPSTNGAP